MPAVMTHRERVLAALSHQEPDCVPVDLSQAAGDAINAIAYKNLLRYLGMADRPITISNKMAQTAHVDEDVLQRFDVDFRGISVGGPEGWVDKVLPNDSYVDEWGVVRTRPAGGYYYDLTADGSPMAGIDTIAGLDSYPWPDPNDPGRVRGLREKAKKLREETDYAVVLTINSCFFLRCGELRGWENFFSDLAGNIPFTEALMDRYLDVKLGIAARALEEVGDLVDVVVASTDDLGSTNSTIISPRTFRALIKPRMKKTFNFYKERTDAKLILHSDGSVYPFMQDFVEIGVDILNPVQVSAKNMGDTRRLKAEFGDKLTFWGAIDTHRVLPYGTPDDVRAEVRQRIRDLGPGGGYVVCSVHNIQSEVPPENVVAMFDMAREYGQYPLRA
ncbi:MAG: uroporphyrinogen decarboxylase family protein [Bacteroidetes bacterium]|nr:uroporphyrinogen decarboxylase family protein [Bacteroidota bacterium]MCL5027343.1 uroporphyrinogen decarboxylase family protein [Chloroflexota bacterium]